MSLELPAFLAALGVAFVVAVATALFALTRRTSLAGVLLAVLLFAVAIWSGGYIFEVLARDVPTVLLWAKIEYIGIVTLAPGWILFALVYSQTRRALGWRLVLALTIIPAITLLLVWTNELHGLIWREIWLSNEGILLLFTARYGPWFWVHTTYTYGCIFIGSIMLLRTLQRHVYRAQAALLITSAVLPVVGNLLYLIGVSPLGRLDITPLIFVISSTLLTWATIGFRLLDLVPIARSTVIDRLREGVVVIDRRRRVLDVNAAALAQAGARAAEVIGEPVEQVLPHVAGLLDRFPPEREGAAELRTVAGGEERWYDMRIIPLSDGRGQVRARMVVWHDISALKQTTAELEQARVAAESASRAKSAFLANMSHELRTPLTAILGYTQLMKMAHMRGELERARADLDSIEVSGNHLLTLIDGILNLAKIEANREVLRLEPASLEELIEQAQRTSQPLISANGNTLTIVNECAVDTITTDPLKLRQVLINLLGNAAKFTYDGTITLRLEREMHPDGDWLTIQVADTGIGIEPEHLLHLFEAFRQADASTTRRFGGTGLGLTISRSYVEMLGGTISVWSEPGQGATFTVRIPAIARAEGYAQQP